MRVQGVTKRERGVSKAKEGSIKTTNYYAPSKVAKEWRNIPFTTRNENRIGKRKKKVRRERDRERERGALGVCVCVCVLIFHENTYV